MKRSRYLLFSRCIALLAIVALPVPSSAQIAAPYGNDPYHIESAPVQTVTAVLANNEHCPASFATHWWVYVPYAPELGSQRNVTETMEITNKGIFGTNYHEPGPLRRLMLKADFNDNSGPVDITAVATIKAVLYSRMLVPGPPMLPISILSRSERAQYTRPTLDHDYTVHTFQQWLDIASLRKSPAERDLNFARRVFDYIRANYDYKYEPTQDRRPSHVCNMNWSDCGGLSELFVSALRANGVPAVTLPGHMAYTATPKDLANCHVKSIFYATGIGWVPVEMSGGASDKTAPAENYFGCEGGNFIALAMDTDEYCDSGIWGIKKYPDLQDFAYWFSGGGDFSAHIRTITWRVASTPVQRAAQ